MLSNLERTHGVLSYSFESSNRNPDHAAIICSWPDVSVWLEEGGQSKHLQTNVIAAIVFY